MSDRTLTLTIPQIGTLGLWKDNYGVPVRIRLLANKTLVAKQGDREIRINEGGNRV